MVTSQDAYTPTHSQRFVLFGSRDGPGNGTARRSVNESAQDEATLPFWTILLGMAYQKAER